MTFIHDVAFVRRLNASSPRILHDDRWRRYANTAGGDDGRLARHVTKELTFPANWVVGDKSWWSGCWGTRTQADVF